MRRVERIVIVVEADPSGSESHARYAELSDGQRIRDPGFFGGGCSWSLFGWNDRDQGWARLMREEHQRDPRRLGRLSAALAEAGVEAKPAELVALPLEIETVEVDSLPEPVPTPAQLRYQRRARIGVWIVGIVIGAIWPSWNRYRAWQRHSWRRRIVGGVGNWTFTNVMREAMRPRRRR